MAGHADELGDTLQPLLDLADTPAQLLAWHRRLRTPGWKRAERSRAAIDAFVDDRIRRERASRGAADRPAGGAMLPLLRGIVHEALRLYPPAMISACGTILINSAKRPTRRPQDWR